MTNRQKLIRDYIIRQITLGDEATPNSVSKHFGLTRQGARRYFKLLADEGVIESTGNTRNQKYSLKELASHEFTLQIVPGLEEDRIWRDEISPMMENQRENVVTRCHHAFTEIVNNAIDHSEGTAISIRIAFTASKIAMQVYDDGIGIFKKIKRELNLEDERHAILELSKGKLTTDEARHTGEGIFFTSRACDSFGILSGELFFDYTSRHGDWLVDDQGPTDGTFVNMELLTDSNRTLRKVFDDYTAGRDDYSFSKTHVPVYLARYGNENLISRSQAKRLLNRLDRFHDVILDFKGVDMIGQAFADEVFRVFPAFHPNCHLRALHANSEIQQMILRATNAASE
jgi:anti-sigma regulatory factor (Ser/Thr protein kinase)/virulence-associated protein VapD